MTQKTTTCLVAKVKNVLIVVYKSQKSLRQKIPYEGHTRYKFKD